MESTVAVVVCRIFTSRDTEGLLEEKKKQQGRLERRIRRSRRSRRTSRERMR